MSASCRENIFVQKIPRLNQNVFSEKSNVMVKLEIPDDIGVYDTLSPKDGLVFDDVPVKQEDGIVLLDSLDKNTFYNGEFTGPLFEDFQCQDRDNFTAVAFKNEVVESECCYEETFIDQEFKDALKNEEIFVGEEFKHEESIPRYEGVESIGQENNEEIKKKKTRSSRKKKKCLDSIDCSHRLAKKPRPHLLKKVVPPKLSIQKPKTRKSQTPLNPNKSESIIHTKDQKTNQEPRHISSPAIPKPRKDDCHGDYRCDHCSYKGQWRKNLIRHLRSKHSLLLSITKPRKKKSHCGMAHCDRCDYEGQQDLLIYYLGKHHVVRQSIMHTKDQKTNQEPRHIFSPSFRTGFVRCPSCEAKFNSWEQMRRHRVVCLLYLICKFCLVDEPTKRAMLFHMNLVHPEKVYAEEGGKILDVVCRYSTKGVDKTLELTPFGHRYMEIRKYFLEIESELVKLYCLKCAVTLDKIAYKTVPSCDICKSRLLFQCKKCKDTRNYYPHIWRHLTGKNSSCSISDHLPFMSQEELLNAMQNRASSIELDHHDCEICDFKGQTKKKLHEHVLNVHLNDGIMENGIADRVPCRFCPTTRIGTRSLSDHIESMHFDELDGRDINEVLKEAADFRKMVKEVNLERFKNKLKNGTVENAWDYYHKGIESMLQSVCIECKIAGTQESEYCAKCQASLNFVCLNCDELFSKYSIAWDHATRMCENRTFTVGETYEDSHSSFQETHGVFRCLECHRSFSKFDDLRQHRFRCREGFHYKCQFCDKFSPNFQVIENHITSVHANRARSKDTLDKILQQVFENKRARTKKTNNEFDEFYPTIRRTFSEGVKLVTFFCPKCDETVHKNFRSAADTKTCPKCNGELQVRCKICNKVHFTWNRMMIHLQIAKCGVVEFDPYDLDHSYFHRNSPSEVSKNLVVM